MGGVEREKRKENSKGKAKYMREMHLWLDGKRIYEKSENPNKKLKKKKKWKRKHMNVKERR